MKKKVLVFCVLFLFLLISVAVFIVGNNTKREIKITTDLDAYSTMWTDYKRYDNSRKSVLFPESIDTLDVDDYLFMYNECVLYPEWQLKLVVKYDKENFTTEVERIKSICKNSPIFGESKYFNSLVYATVWDYSWEYEYAIIDENNFEIIYIYFQNVDTERSDFVIGKKYIPKNYYDRYSSGEEGNVYCIYVEP